MLIFSSQCAYQADVNCFVWPDYDTSKEGDAFRNLTPPSSGLSLRVVIGTLNILPFQINHDIDEYIWQGSETLALNTITALDYMYVLPKLSGLNINYGGSLIFLTIESQFILIMTFGNL